MRIAFMDSVGWLRPALVAAYPSVSFSNEGHVIGIADPQLGKLGGIHYHDWLGPEFSWTILAVEGVENDDLMRRTRGVLSGMPFTRTDYREIRWCPHEVWIRYTVAEAGEAAMIAAIGDFRERCGVRG